MQRTKWMIILAALVILGGVGYGVLRSYYARPLGPALDLPTLTARPATAILAVAPTDALETPASAATRTPTLAPTATPPPLCGGPAQMTILAIGSDARGNHYLYGLSDIMRIVRVDFVKPAVTILEVPRDLWVEIPGIAEHYGITHGKLNQAYLYGNKGLGYYDGPGEGPGLLARTLDLNFGIRADHYLAVNMRTFVNIVDAVGGLDIYLPYNVDIRSKENPNAPHYEAGSHHMDGETSLMLARIRQVNVFGRADNQNIVMCALRKKLLNPSAVPHIPEFVSTFLHYVQTDFSPEQINQLACLAPQVEGKNIRFVSFPQELFKQSRMYDPDLKGETFIFEADFNLLRDYVTQFNAGTWPPPAEDLATAPALTGTEEYTCP
jgi:polyisoprenyl-teichoic acid--peptidoglycan teichoic acid transferase